ncbi:MAG TPA: hypothetical protein VNE63_20480 [Candidatus Acidoferrales bacterium]|nr:hypothetical protein [Candidatus Acidoferrales bacterium]
MTARPIRDKSEKSGARPAIVLAAVALVVAIFLVEFGLQTLVGISSKRWAAVDPWLGEVPQAFPSTQPGDLASQVANGSPRKKTALDKIKAYDYEFTAPWPGKSKPTAGSIYTGFQFDSGQVIVFYNPEAQLDTVGEMKTGKTTEEQQFENVFGDQTPDTNYQLYQMVYGVSPVQVSPLMQRPDAMKMNVLLLWKLSFGFDMQPGVHSLTLGKNRGFEFGDPTSGRPVALRIFDERDQQFRFIFTALGGASGKFTQDDINVAVQSLQSVPILER